MNQSQPRGAVSVSTDVFVPAPVPDVWAIVCDPAQIPVWQPGIATVDDAGNKTAVGMTWIAHALTTAPDGKAIRVPAAFRRRGVQLVDMRQGSHITWRFTHPVTQRSRATATEFRLEPTPGGTTVTLATTWFAYRGWRRVIGVILRPVQRYLIWITNGQIGSGLSRAFRA